MTVTEIPLRMEPVTQDTFLSGTPTGMGYTGGVDLGGTKIQAVVVDEAARSPASRVARRRRPAARPTSRRRSPARCARRPPRRASRPSALEGIGIGSPGNVDDDAGTVSAAMNLPGWGGSFDMRESLEKSCGAPVSLGNDVQVATDAEFALGSGAPVQLAARRVLGHRRRRRHRARRASRGSAATRRARSATSSSRIGGALCGCGAAAAWRRTPAAPRWRPARAGAPTAARRPCCSRSWRSAAARG